MQICTSCSEKKVSKNFNNSVEKSSFMSFLVKKMSNILTKFFKKFFHKFSEHESLKNYFSLAKGFHTNQNFFVNVKNETFQNLTIISQKMAWPSTDIIYELRHISGRLKKPLELKSVKKACPTVSEPSWAGRPRSNFLSTSSVRPRFVFSRQIVPGETT